MPAVLVLFALSLIAATVHSAPGATKLPRQVRSYAVIIANNASQDPGVEPLRYADDDGVRYYQLLSAYLDEVTLFALLDAETQRQHRNLASEAKAPFRAAILERIEMLNARMAQDRREGRVTEFFFVYSGHGNVGENRQGYIQLADSRFTRDDLFREVLARSTADFNHVVIDACHSYHMVYARGDWMEDHTDADHRDLITGYLAGTKPESHPNTGFLLSTSSSREVHEYSEYAAGVFSHALRSALTGAADVNGDGRIEYSEVKAFIAAANSRIDNPRARLSISANPPAVDLSRPLVDLNRGRFDRFLLLASGDGGRFHLEDMRGVRYADFNKSAEAPLTIALLPAGFYYLRDERREARLEVGMPGRINFSKLEFVPRLVSARGSLGDEYHRNLFATPYGPSFYSGYVASTGDIPVDFAGSLSQVATNAVADRSQPLGPWAWASTGIGAAAGLGAAVSALMARDAYDDFRARFEATGLRDAALERAVDDRRLASNVLLGAALAAGVTGLVLFLVDATTATPAEESTGGYDSNGLEFGLAPGQAGGLLVLRGAF